MVGSPLSVRRTMLLNTSSRPCSISRRRQLAGRAVATAELMLVELQRTTPCPARPLGGDAASVQDEFEGGVLPQPSICSSSLPRVSCTLRTTKKIEMNAARVYRP